MSFYDAIRVGASGAADFEIERSLRFNNDDNTHLIRTIGSTSNRKTYTYSFWIKRTVKAAEQYVLYNGHLTSTPYVDARFEANSHQFQFIDYDGSHQMRIQTNRRFRDPGAWYHFVIAIDTTQSTESDRAKFYVNGEQETSFSIANYPSLNQDTAANVSGHVQTMGAIKASSTNDLDGYLAEVNFIDGLQLTPSSFAETNSDTGQWVPIDTSGLTFGTNGFRLQFADNSGTTATTLGKDTSGNSNNFTPNNFSVADGIDGDSFADTPTNNFCTLNSLVRSQSDQSLTNGNLQRSGNAYKCVGTFLLKNNKYYFEAKVEDGNGNAGIGVTQADTDYRTRDNTEAAAYFTNGEYKIEGGSQVSGFSTYGNGDIIGVAIDTTLSTPKVWFSKNNTWQGTGDPTTAGYSLTAGKEYVFNIDHTSGSSSTAATAFFGAHKGEFNYTPPTGFVAASSANLDDPTILLPNKHFDTLLYSGNGSQNRAISGLEFQPDWVWLKSRSNGYYHQIHDTVRGTAAGVLYSNRTDAEDSTYGLASFDNNGFTVYKDANNDAQNDSGQTYVAWNWNAGGSASKTYRVVVSSAGGSGNKYRFRNSANSATFAADAVTLDLEEGGTYTFDGSDSTMASHPIKLSTTANGTHGGGSSYNTGVTYELDGSTVTESAYVSGYSSATSRKLIITVAASAPTLYYYCHYHSGMGGQINTNSTFGSSNFDGSTQSTVKANTTAGFSIVKYTGQQNATDTIGHGLGVKPQAVISKSRNSTYTYTRWYVHHHKLTTNYGLFLDDTTAAYDGLGDYYVDASFSSTVFAVGNDIYGPNVSNNNYIAYCFNEVEGYSKFGQYTGNGNASGTFVFTGFRPAWVMIKRTDSAKSWAIFDNKRDPDNVASLFLYANTAGSENNFDFIDLLSNGFKFRTNSSLVNDDGNSYIYFAFAKSPFKNSRAR